MALRVKTKNKLMAVSLVLVVFRLNKIRDENYYKSFELIFEGDRQAESH